MKVYTHVNLEAKRQAVASAGVKEKRGKRLREFVQRMNRNRGYYTQLVGPANSGLTFIAKMIDGWYPDPTP